MEHWRQADTLSPPPLPGHEHLLPGVHVGDPTLDELGVGTLMGMMHAKDASAFGPIRRPAPSWDVDWDALRRGQRLYAEMYDLFHLALVGILIQGYVIGRFSDVLVAAGYASSERATYDRFFHTSYAIREMMQHGLSDPESRARVSIDRVRTMHAFARNVAEGKLWAAQRADNGDVGVCLSQYDLALVQLGFSAICLSGIERECKRVLTQQQVSDYIHLWRFIGYHLGIQDEYNVCSSTEEAIRQRDVFFTAMPYYTQSIRPSTTAMVRATVNAFSRRIFPGYGYRAMAAFVGHMGSSRPWMDTSYVKDACGGGGSPSFVWALEKWLEWQQWVGGMSRCLEVYYRAHEVCPRIVRFVEDYVSLPLSYAADMWWWTLDTVVGVVLSKWNTGKEKGD